MRFFRRDSYIVKKHLVHFMATIHEHQRPDADAGVFISMSKKEIPCCLFGKSALVRTRQNIQSACWAQVVQIFWPLTTKLSPSRTALVLSEAKSEPEPGSEVALAPEYVAIVHAGQKALFLLLRAKFVQDGRTPWTRQREYAAGSRHSRILLQKYAASTMVQFVPPHSSGQSGAPQPRSA